MNDLIGQRFGALKIIEELPREKYAAARVRCKCDCGNEKVVLLSNLKRGYTRSCGCGASNQSNVFHITLNDTQTIAAWIKSGAQSKDELVAYLTGIITGALEE